MLKKDPVSVQYSSKFKHWVKQRKFQLVTYSALGLYDVLCLPTKTEVCVVIVRTNSVLLSDISVNVIPFSIPPESQ